MTNEYEYYNEPLAKHSAIWGDQYAVTMSAALFKNNEHNTPATFHTYIRKNPFQGGYLLTAGQNIIKEWLDQHWKFDEIDIKRMRNEKVLDNHGNPIRLYSDEFIEMCANSKLELTIDAMPEGEIAFPDEPIYRVHGPLWQCLMVETPILNVTNSQSLFATLASRLTVAAGGDPILEFGLRRAQSIGGLESSRGSFIGGVSATSNNEAGKHYGIPTKGTFAHAWVMAQEDELDAFKKYSKAMPHNGIFLVDTYDTERGVKRAAQACRDIEVNLKGIRLDSGDLAYLSKRARKILDKEGFPHAKIVASNDLDEQTVSSLKAQGAKIDVWGIGTNLVTSKAQPALGAVYKLGAIFNQKDTGFVRDTLKLSEDQNKITIPGELSILRYIVTDPAGKPIRYDGDTLIPSALEDFIRDERLATDIISVRKNDATLRKKFTAGTMAYNPLKRIFDKGKLVVPIETIHEAHTRAMHSLSMLDETHRRLLNPHTYIVGLEQSLFDKRERMMKKARGLDI